MYSLGTRNCWAHQEPAISFKSEFKRFSVIKVLKGATFIINSDCYDEQRTYHRTRCLAQADSTVKFDIIGECGVGRYLRGDDRK